MLPTSAGSNPRPPDLQSDAHPTEPPRPASFWGHKTITSINFHKKIGLLYVYTMFMLILGWAVFVKANTWLYLVEQSMEIN